MIQHDPQDTHRRSERHRIIITAATIYAAGNVNVLQAVRTARTLIAAVDTELEQLELKTDT